MYLGINTLLYLCNSSPTADAFYTFNIYLGCPKRHIQERYQEWMPECLRCVYMYTVKRMELGR